MYYGEKFNAISHLCGVLMALAGSVVLVIRAATTGDPWKISAAAIYGTTLVLLYGISTLYHSVGGPAKDILRKLDHQSIYLLIAGSYTPFCLVTLHGPWGWFLLGVVWGLALLGGLQELLPRKGERMLSVVIYIVMGWSALAAIKPLLDTLGAAGFAWLVVGGVLYTVGIIFFILDTRYPHAHGIWHLFVLAGSTAHYVAIARYVL